MPITLGQNLISLRVQNRLGVATGDLTRASERLSSGQRINRASDDAAGLAVSMSLNADSRIFSQATRNLGDGISAMQIADGALSMMDQLLVRIEELSTQSMNGVYSDTQRMSMQQEVLALQAETNRIIATTKFNGQTLLAGTDSQVVLQGVKGTANALSI